MIYFDRVRSIYSTKELEYAKKAGFSCWRNSVRQVLFDPAQSARLTFSSYPTTDHCS